MEWYNEPPHWAVQGESIFVTSAPTTDFWRKTHYGFVRDNGHFYYEQATGDFDAQVKIAGAYAAQYDQAGLMVRLDARNWIKTGIELVEGLQYISAVVTRDYSDWSVVPLAEAAPTLWLRLTRRASAIEVHYALNGADYRLLRLAYLPPADRVRVGPMCASPEGEGFEAMFEGFRVTTM